MRMKEEFIKIYENIGEYLELNKKRIYLSVVFAALLIIYFIFMSEYIKYNSVILIIVILLLLLIQIVTALFGFVIAIYSVFQVGFEFKLLKNPRLYLFLFNLILFLVYLILSYKNSTSEYFDFVVITLLSFFIPYELIGNYRLKKNYKPENESKKKKWLTAEAIGNCIELLGIFLEPLITVLLEHFIN